MDGDMSENQRELSKLCNTVRELISQNNIEESYALVTNAMGKHPHAPQPHNLIGVLLEKEGNHTSAMKHFRAAWALEPTYIPARYNLDRFASFYAVGGPAFDEYDCPEDAIKGCDIKYNEKGISHMGRGIT